MAQILRDPPQVQRLAFPKVISPSRFGCCETPVLSFTSRVPSPLALVDGERASNKGIIAIDPDMAGRIHSAITEIQIYSRPDEKGPYADRDGVVRRLADEIRAGTSSREEVIDRAMDILRPFMGPDTEIASPRTHTSREFNFVLNEGYTRVPDLPSHAGILLTSKERRTLIEEPQMAAIILTSVFEPYILAASALRMAGMYACPSLAVLTVDNEAGGKTEMNTPLLSILDLTDEVPLRTFALMRTHPNFVSLVLLSDEAVMGISSIILAENRGKHLAYELVEHSRAGRQMPQEAVDNQLKRIANSLFEGHLGWPGTYLINEALGFLRSTIGEAMGCINLAKMQKMLSSHTGIDERIIGTILVQSFAPDIAASVQCARTMFSSFADETGYAGPTVDLGSALVEIERNSALVARNVVEATLGYLNQAIDANKPLETSEGYAKPAEK